MKTRKWIVITILAFAMSMPVPSVNAAPSASITIPPFISPDSVVEPIDSIPVAKGMVLREGTPVNSNQGGGSLACSEVKIIPSISAPVFTIDESALPNFEVSLSNPSAGAYIIQAGYSGYLASEVRTTIPPSMDVGTTTLCGGDVNADRVINILDVGKIIGKFGSAGVPVRSDAPDCSDADDPADLNDDGLINISDLVITAGNWGQTGPTTWGATQCGP